MRDGRDVVESAIASGRIDQPSIGCGSGPRDVGEFLISPEGTGQGSRGNSWEFVRYEEIVDRPEVTVKGMLEFLGIDELDAHGASCHICPYEGHRPFLMPKAGSVRRRWRNPRRSPLLGGAALRSMAEAKIQETGRA